MNMSLMVTLRNKPHNLALCCGFRWAMRSCAWNLFCYLDKWDNWTRDEWCSTVQMCHPALSASCRPAEFDPQCHASETWPSLCWTPSNPEELWYSKCKSTHDKSMLLVLYVFEIKGTVNSDFLTSLCRNPPHTVDRFGFHTRGLKKKSNSPSLTPLTFETLKGLTVELQAEAARAKTSTCELDCC